LADRCDGVRLANALAGDGPPLVKAPNCLTHLEYDWDSRVWRHWMCALASRLVRCDERGCGMSDLDVDDFSLDTWVADLEVVVDEVGLERFPLLGISAGGPVAVAYAVRHPERVTFRRVFTTLFLPQGTLEQLEWFDELQRITTPPANAIRFERAFWDVDVRTLAPRVTAPTLILQGALLAAVRHGSGVGSTPVSMVREASRDATSEASSGISSGTSAVASSASRRAPS
jgi:pimeloyl-ACP methyl ester carboxylesterase